MAEVPFAQESRWRTASAVRLSGDRQRLLFVHPYADVRRKDLTEVELARDFAALANQSDEAYMAFAALFGPLVLCRTHGIPMTHLRGLTRAEVEADLADDHDVSYAFTRRTIAEDVAAWRTLSAEAAAMLSLGEALSVRGVEPHDPRWLPLRRLFPVVETAEGSDFYGDEDRVEVQRLMLRYAVQRWLDWGDVGVVTSWPTRARSRLDVRLGASTLFGTIALGVALACASNHDLRMCAGCGKAFLPRRRRDPSKRAWCGDEACQAIKNRDEQRRWREKVRRTARQVNAPGE